MAAARPHVARRIAAIRAAIEGAEDWDAAERNLLTLAAEWTPDALAALIRQATDLAALEGREAVFAEGDAEAAFAEPDFTRLEFREAIDFLTQKRPRPTRAWTDAMRGDHDRSFVVAGVTDMAMLEEFQTAVVAARKTLDRRAFAADFDRLVAKYGWEYKGGREWRIRTIFETNIRTSYMAGRLRQMRDPDVTAVRPYWQYVHAETRLPLSPRPQHLAWDGLVLMWDDPWWDVYFPPNDWKCSCGVHTLSERQLMMLGKTGPDKAPPILRRPYTHRASGETVQQPVGTGYGWDYMPGDQWERGLVPSALLDDPRAVPVNDPLGRHLVAIDTPDPIEDLIARARPFRAEVLPEGLPPATYVDALLRPFGSQRGEAVLWQDPAGERLLLAADMFFARNGAWKGDKPGHATYAALIAEALQDPDEIWLGVRPAPVPGFPDAVDQVVTRRFIRIDPGNGLMVLFELGQRHWRAITGYAALRGQSPGHRHIALQRIGLLLWRRR